MATWQFDCYLVPGDAVTPVAPYAPPSGTPERGFDCGADIDWWGERRPLSALFEGLDAWLGARADGEPGWGDVEGTCAEVFHDWDIPYDVFVRIDVRGETADHVAALCRMARTAGCRLYLPDEQRVIEADGAALAAAIRRSNANRFVRDPRGFLDSLGSGED